MNECGSRVSKPISLALWCSFYDKDSPIYTMSRFLPPSKVLDAEVTNSILGDGCVVRAGTTITHSVIGLRSLIGENCHIEDALLMGCARRVCALAGGRAPRAGGPPPPPPPSPRTLQPPTVQTPKLAGNRIAFDMQQECTLCCWPARQET